MPCQDIHRNPSKEATHDAMLRAQGNHAQAISEAENAAYERAAVEVDAGDPENPNNWKHRRESCADAIRALKHP